MGITYAQLMLDEMLGKGEARSGPYRVVLVQLHSFV